MLVARHSAVAPQCPPPVGLPRWTTRHSYPVALTIKPQKNHEFTIWLFNIAMEKQHFSPPARWGLLDFMSVASSSSSSASSCLDLLLLVLLVILVVLAQLRPAIHSVPCRTSATTIHAQCSLPDLNHDHPRPVFPAGPQLGVDGRGWGPAGNTGRGWSWLRSGREHWARMVAVEVRQGEHWARMVVVEVRQGTCRKIWDKECAEES